MRKTYFKNIDTGVVKTQLEWYQEGLEFFKNKYKEDVSLQEEFDTVEKYLEWVDERGYLFNDLIQCDEAGNPIEE